LEGEKEIEDLSNHVEYQDLDKIGKIFDIKDVERRYENGFLNTLYSKLALKNL
jgi:hypothetical protein